MIKKETLINEISFEKNCSISKAIQIYEEYKKKNKLKELENKVKNHKEV